MKLIDTKYLLIERDAYMGYSNCRYFDDYFNAKREFNNLKKLNISCTIIAFNYIETYQYQFSEGVD